MKIYGATKIHGFHIHESGNMDNGCMSMGNHYNPTNMDHGNITDAVRHVGDMGNLVAENSAIIYSFTDKVMSLFSDTNIYGKGCVIHALVDDLGRGQGDSKKNGNSGARIACGVVQEHNPLKSILFGTTIVIVGVALLVYYFFFRKTEPQLITNEGGSEVKTY